MWRRTLVLAFLALFVPARAATPCAVLHAPPPGDGCVTLALFDAWRRGAPQTCPAEWAGAGLGDHRALPPVLRGAPRADKQVRDAYGTFEEYDTANFAVKWGALTGFTEAEAQALADDFEVAWQTEVGTFGYPAPLTTDTYKFNVYIGDSGGGTPDSLGSDGYYWYDPQGYPMIVIAASVVPDAANSGLTSAHEFFHGVQDAEGYFDWSQTTSAWYGEATAMWMENQVYPDDPDYAEFLYWFAIRPELSLNYYKYPQNGSPEEYHQYGAFVFIDELSQNVEDPSLIKRSFEAGQPGADALDVLDGLLAGDGHSLRDVFADFVGRNATWDYEHRDWYQQWIDAYGGYSASESHRPTGTLAGATDWTEPAANLPHGWGANYWRLRGFTGDAVVRFDGTVDPSHQPDKWIVTVATRTGDVHNRYPLDMIGERGFLPAASVGTPDEAWLVVAPIAPRDATTYTYQVSMEVPPPSSGVSPKACGCRTAPGVAGSMWLPWLLPWLVRRRRQPARSQAATSVA